MQCLCCQWREGNTQAVPHVESQWSLFQKKKFLQPSCNQSTVVSFGRHLDKFKKGELKSDDGRKRSKKGQFEEVEKKLVEYIKLRAKLYKKDGCGTSFLFLCSKAAKYAKDCGYDEDEFKASVGWVQKVMRRHGITGLNLHGEACDMNPEERMKIMEEWRIETFHPVIDKYSIPPERIYNADQTGLFYQKLPNRLYIEKEKKKQYAGAKQMKDKTRVTLMVGTAADGRKMPMAMIGTSKQPVCFDRQCIMPIKRKHGSTERSRIGGSTRCLFLGISLNLVISIVFCFLITAVPMTLNWTRCQNGFT